MPEIFYGQIADIHGTWNVVWLY